MIATSLKRLSMASAMAALLAMLAAVPAMASTPTITAETANAYGRGATLNATIETHGKATLYNFIYGTTEKYGQEGEVAELPAGETGATQVSMPISGLTPNTTYHFALVASTAPLQESEGIVVGKDSTFATRGLYLTGEKSGEEAAQPKIASTKYPALLRSYTEKEKKFKLFVGGGTAIECSISDNEDGFASSSFSSFATGFESVSNCNYGSTVASNGCQYRYQLANAGPPYSGSAEVVCPEGSQLEIKVGSFINCTVKISSQAAGGSVEFTEVSAGESPGRGAVKVKTNSATITDKLEGGTGCSALGKGTGSFGGNLILDSIS